jgi:hypothetical protein
MPQSPSTIDCLQVFCVDRDDKALLGALVFIGGGLLMVILLSMVSIYA